MHLEKGSYPRPAALPPQAPLDPALPGYDPGPERQAWLRCVVSETTVQVVERLIFRFRLYHPEIRIDTFVGGSTATSDAFAGRWADLAVIARELRPDENEVARRALGRPPARIPIAGGSHRTPGYTDTVVVVTHPDVPVTGLTIAALRRIFGDEADPPLDTWAQLIPDADLPIHRWAPALSNGFGNFFREHVLGPVPFGPAVHLMDRVNAVADAVGSTPGGVGVTGLGHTCGQVRVLAIGDLPDRLTAPTFDNVLARRYPLSRSIYLYSSKLRSVSAGPAVLEFLRFVLSAEGQQCVVDDGIFLPAGAAVARAAWELATGPRPAAVSRPV